MSDHHGAHDSMNRQGNLEGCLSGSLHQSIITGSLHQSITTGTVAAPLHQGMISASLHYRTLSVKWMSKLYPTSNQIIIKPPM